MWTKPVSTALVNPTMNLRIRISVAYDDHRPLSSTEKSLVPGEYLAKHRYKLWLAACQRMQS